MVARSKKRSTRRSRRRPWWLKLTDRELLDTRLCDLELRIEGTWIEACVHQLYEELAERSLRLRPHVWISTEWFSPDGIPGIAIPFFLTHDRLMRLEKRKMLEVEGGSDREGMKLLRHEAGHALSTAFRLHHRQSWRDTFGPVSTPYPDSYKPRARSRDHVLHLDGWYAQAHPAEDFAETFAVWLTPASRWRRRYRDWPALAKLEYVDGLMERIAGQAPSVRSRRHVEPLSSQRTTLHEYYEAKQDRYGVHGTPFYGEDLQNLFSNEERHATRPSAAAWLRQARPRIREVVVRYTGEYAYTVDQVIAELIDRCKQHKLRLRASSRTTMDEAIALVAVQTTRVLHRSPQRIVL